MSRAFFLKTGCHSQLAMPIRTVLPSYDCRVPDVCLANGSNIFSEVAALVIRLGNLVDLFEECFETITYLSHLIP